jgi:hypothetical protein
MVGCSAAADKARAASPGGVPMAGASEPQVRYELARNRARGLLTLTRQHPPVHIEAIIDLAGVVPFSDASASRM